MPLRKSVCKKCRSKEIGKGSWNDIMESWFHPYYEKGIKTREGSTSCPYPIFDRIGKRIKKKAIKNATPVEKFMIKSGFVTIENIQSSYPWPVKRNPPLWCPYKSDHQKN